jgi:hypothetical protein
MDLKKVKTIKNFFSRVQITSSCWIWRGTMSPGGYPRFSSLIHSKTMLAHRFSYETFVGELKEGMQIDHLCKNTRCVNPVHLDQVTPRENTLRSNGITAQYSRQTSCISGHPYNNIDTLYLRSGRIRRCRICDREAAKRFYWRKKEKITSNKE